MKNKFTNLKDARLSLNKTMKQVATDLEISESYYSLIEGGKRRATVDLAAKISENLNITLDEFFLLYNYTKCKNSSS
jgi:transcriptional regulator with XRE-family HTH domain